MTVTTMWEVLADPDPVFTVAEDLFATMIDREPGYLMRWYGERPAILRPCYTWVDVVGGDDDARILISMARDTGEDLARVLFELGDDEPVTDADFTDAVGELVNVVGGNVKSLVTHPGILTMPKVSDEQPSMADAAPVMDACVTWRGALVCVSLWTLPQGPQLRS
ncbi:chemotaxis protein CheX [Demequina capsici]|uniref:Chemotaxis protein CheX n=1 Tax=Demequina capsici TaxID=3075620 RepID=A0AA96JAX8_9MICO|nr:MULTISPECIES: chemotaxis protein CheX [unclassified Demequina]WNM24581.1 chemotaxis protein CheX [Demequina sp. OYTSA14]WNM27433.1 chemotaxis protein CheX [Demequina sp. PMTSA13]